MREAVKGRIIIGPGEGAVAEKTRRISKKEFVNRFTELTVRYFSRLSPEEQEKRLSAFERRVVRIGHGKVSGLPARQDH